MKKGNRRRPHKGKSRKRKSEQPFTLTHHPFAGLDPRAVKTALTQLASKRTEEFPVLMGRLLDLFHRKNPLQILGTLGAYGLHVSVSDEGVANKSIVSKIQQNHVEVAQALVVSIPITEWGRLPALPDNIQAVGIGLTNDVRGLSLRLFHSFVKDLSLFEPFLHIGIFPNI
jgi:hypothetical protein